MGTGIKLLIIGLLFAGVVTAAYAVVSKYNHAIAEAEESKALAKKIEGERDGWIEVAAEQNTARMTAEAAAKSRAQAQARLQQERDNANQELVKLRSKTENVNWLDQPLPSDIVAWLRQHTGKQAPAQDGTKPSPGGAPRGVPDPAVRRAS